MWKKTCNSHCSTSAVDHRRWGCCAGDVWRRHWTFKWPRNLLGILKCYNYNRRKFILVTVYELIFGRYIKFKTIRYVTDCVYLKLHFPILIFFPAVWSCIFGYHCTTGIHNTSVPSTAIPSECSNDEGQQTRNTFSNVMYGS